MAVVLKIFGLWARICQSLGLLLVSHDKKADKFKLWPHSSLYCVVFGSAISVLYPFIMSQFALAIPSDPAFSFAVAVSIAAYLWNYACCIFTYVQQYRNRFKMQKTLNNFLYFYRQSKCTYQEFEELGSLKSLQAQFFFSVSLKIILEAIGLTSLYLFVKPGAWRLWLGMITFPAVVSFAICGQYIYGVLVVSYFLATTNRKIQALIKQLEHNRIICPRKLVEHFDFILNQHTQANLMIRELSSYYDFQIIFIIFNNFIAVATAAFQIVCMILLHFQRNYNFWSFNQVIAANIALIVGVSVDLVFQFSICEKCTENVSLHRKCLSLCLTVSIFSISRMTKLLTALFNSINASKRITKCERG